MLNALFIFDLSIKTSIWRFPKTGVLHPKSSEISPFFLKSMVLPHLKKPPFRSETPVFFPQSSQDWSLCRGVWSLGPSFLGGRPGHFPRMLGPRTPPLPRPGLPGKHGGRALLPHQSSLQAWWRLELTGSFFLLILNAWEKLAGNETQRSLFPPNPVCTVAWVCPKLKWGTWWSMLEFWCPYFWTTRISHRKWSRAIGPSPAKKRTQKAEVATVARGAGLAGKDLRFQGLSRGEHGNLVGGLL